MIVRKVLHSKAYWTKSMDNTFIVALDTSSGSHVEYVVDPHFRETFNVGVMSANYRCVRFPLWRIQSYAAGSARAMAASWWWHVAGPFGCHANAVAKWGSVPMAAAWWALSRMQCIVLLHACTVVTAQGGRSNCPQCVADQHLWGTAHACYAHSTCAVQGIACTCSYSTQVVSQTATLLTPCIISLPVPLLLLLQCCMAQPAAGVCGHALPAAASCAAAV